MVVAFLIYPQGVFAFPLRSYGIDCSYTNICGRNITSHDMQFRNLSMNKDFVLGICSMPIFGGTPKTFVTYISSDKYISVNIHIRYMHKQTMRHVLSQVTSAFQTTEHQYKLPYRIFYHTVFLLKVYLYFSLL